MLSESDNVIIKAFHMYYDRDFSKLCYNESTKSMVPFYNEGLRSLGMRRADIRYDAIPGWIIIAALDPFAHVEVIATLTWEQARAWYAEAVQWLADTDEEINRLGHKTDPDTDPDVEPSIDICLGFDQTGDGPWRKLGEEVEKEA